MNTKIITYSKDLNSEQINKIEEVFKTCFPNDKIILIREGMLINIKDYSSCLTTTTASNNCDGFTLISKPNKIDNSNCKDQFVYTLT